MKDFRLPQTPIITGNPQAAQTGKARVNGNLREESSFRDLLGQAVAEKSRQTTLTLSRHARQRAEQRSIELSEADLERMGEAVGKAGEKGVTDTLVFMNNTAFIVNIPSKVVVTIVDGQESKENVFTNINGAVIL